MFSLFSSGGVRSEMSRTNSRGVSSSCIFCTIGCRVYVLHLRDPSIEPTTSCGISNYAITIPARLSVYRSGIEFFSYRTTYILITCVIHLVFTQPIISWGVRIHILTCLCWRIPCRRAPKRSVFSLVIRKIVSQYKVQIGLHPLLNSSTLSQAWSPWE
jgi:hypothetical protein